MAAPWFSHVLAGDRSGRLVAAATAATATAVATAVPATRRALGREAIRAVDWLVAAGLEGHHGVLAALRAHGREHLPLASLESAATTTGISAAARLVGGSALGAPARGIGEALLCEELLLSHRENELLATVPAVEGLVIHVVTLTPDRVNYLERSVS